MPRPSRFNNQVNVRLSDAELAALDRVRGKQRRGGCIRDLIAEAALKNELAEVRARAYRDIHHPKGASHVVVD